MLYKVECGKLYFCGFDEEWEPNLNSAEWCNKHLKPIPPRPLAEYVYEEVTDEIFDLKERLGKGELFFWDDGKYEAICTVNHLCSLYADDRVYRRVEKKLTGVMWLKTT